jgi:hypothetical protein
MIFTSDNLTPSADIFRFHQPPKDPEQKLN